MEKRPDGISLAPWKNGKCLIWDATCPDTYAPSHRAVTAGGAGELAEQAEQTKCLEYSALESKFFFVPIAIESSGVFDPKAYTFLTIWADALNLFYIILVPSPLLGSFYRRNTRFGFILANYCFAFISLPKYRGVLFIEIVVKWY